MTITEKLNKSRSDLKKVEAERSRLVDAISKLETEISLPDIKKRYEGKYFKYRNSYGPRSKGWWLYSFVIEVMGPDNFIVDSFETDEKGEAVFQHKKSEFSEHLFQQSIHKSVYNAALKKFKEALNKL